MHSTDPDQDYEFYTRRWDFWAQVRFWLFIAWWGYPLMYLLILIDRIRERLDR